MHSLFRIKFVHLTSQVMLKVIFIFSFFLLANLRAETDLSDGVGGSASASGEDIQSHRVTQFKNCMTQILDLAKKNNLLKNNDLNSFGEKDSSYYSATFSKEQWLSFVDFGCDFSDASFKLLPLSESSLEGYKAQIKLLDYNFNNYYKVSDDDNAKVLQISFYSPLMSEIEFKNMLTELRKKIGSTYFQAGKFQFQKEFMQLSVYDSTAGRSYVIDSLEKLIANSDENGAYIDGESYFSYAPSINWVFNEFFSVTQTLDQEGAKFGNNITNVYKFVNSAVSPVSELTEFMEEKQLLKNLKQDWLIRNSNQWVYFEKATNIDDFWDFNHLQNRKYSRPSDYDTEVHKGVSYFISYSSRNWDKAKAKSVQDCASKASNLDSKVAPKNKGYLCLAKVKGIIFYEYSLTKEDLTKNVNLLKRGNQINLTLPVHISGGGEAPVQIVYKIFDASKDFFSDKVPF